MRKVIVLIAGALVLASLGFLAYQRQGRPTTLEGLYDEYHRRGLRMHLQSPFNGAVLVARDAEVVFEQAYGFADSSRAEALTVDSSFLLGAAAKPITATLVLQQVEAGVLDLDAALTTYLDDFPEEPGSRITLHHLLSHTSGLPLSEVDLERLTLNSEPGTRYDFSNFGYELLASVLERAAGRTYAELVSAGVVEPLGLEHTGFAGDEALASEVAAGMNFREHPYPLALVATGVGTYDEATPPTDGAFYTSVADLLRIVQALRGNELLSEEMTERMFTPNLQGYAYGWARNRRWAIERNPDAPLYTHVGRVAGHNALVGLYDEGLTVIVLSNVEPLNADIVLHDTWLAAHGLAEVSTKLKQPSLSNPRAFQTDGGVDAFLGYYRTLSERAGYPIEPSEQLCEQLVRLLVRGDRLDEAVEFIEHAADRWARGSAAPLNSFGYLFLEEDRLEDARRFFEWNVELHPENANAHDSLGEFHERHGEIELARQHYGRAAELARAQNDRMADFYERRLAAVEDSAVPATP